MVSEDMRRFSWVLEKGQRLPQGVPCYPLGAPIISRVKGF